MVSPTNTFNLYWINLLRKITCLFWVHLILSPLSIWHQRAYSTMKATATRTSRKKQNNNSARSSHFLVHFSYNFACSSRIFVRCHCTTTTWKCMPWFLFNRGYVCGPEVIQLQENWPLFEKLSGWLIVIKKKNDIGSYFANVFFPALAVVLGARKHLISFPLRFSRFIPLPPSFHLALTKTATDRKITTQQARTT